MIGDTLRREREKQNLTIKDIEHGTSIRSLYIEAIENGNYQALPGEVYTKGFIRNYANFLKLDPNACLEQYMADTHASEIIAAEAETMREADATPARPKKRPKVERTENSGNGGTVLVAAALLLVIGGAYILLGGSDDKTADKRHNRPSTVAAQEMDRASESREIPKPNFTGNESVVDKPAQTQPENNSRTAAQRAANEVEVVATFTDQCWTRVVADGQIIFEGTPGSGNTFTWKGKDNITITMGNAGAIELVHNGKNLGKAGSAGQVVDRVFTRTGVN